jgi:alanyl-tRNA synthetase
MGDLGGEEVELYQELLRKLQQDGDLDSGGVVYNPYQDMIYEGKILGLISEGKLIKAAKEKDNVQVVLPSCVFYMEAGGQVSDTGIIRGDDWSIQIDDVYQPAAGMIVHLGTVQEGSPKIGDHAVAEVDQTRRRDIMRNHTGTHLLHAALNNVLGEHARQAGSLVAPDHLRFDFTHNQALTDEEILAVEEEVNQRILEDHPLEIKHKPLQEAIDGGARALFGEKYGDVVRTISIGDFSYELCGGTHSERSSDVGLFLITSEGSTAAGIRRIVAVTGQEAYQLVRSRFKEIKEAAALLSTGPDSLASQVKATIELQKKAEKTRDKLLRKVALIELESALENIQEVGEIKLLTQILEDSDLDTMRVVADRFRQQVPSQGIVVLATVIDGAPRLIAAVTEDLIKKGLKAGDLIQFAAKQVGGGGGGRPAMAEAGGKDPNKLKDALESIPGWIESNLSS